MGWRFNPRVRRRPAAIPGQEEEEGFEGERGQARHDVAGDAAHAAMSPTASPHLGPSRGSYNFVGLGDNMAPNLLKFIRFGGIHGWPQTL